MATPNTIVQEVLQGKWGNAETRKQKLRAAGYSYIEIQSLINIQYGAKPMRASIDELAQEVLEGRWGNGADRKARLTAAGQDYNAVQKAVNLIIANGGNNNKKDTTPVTPSNNLPSNIKVGTVVTAKGIDISYWQGEVNFTKVKASGIDFVIFREGYGTTVDKKFFDYCNGAKQAKLAIHGVYHFCYSVNENEALNEAKSCIQNVQRAGLPKSTIIFFDFEYDTVTKARNRGVILGKNQCIAFTKTFCNYVQSQGYIPGVYSNLDYYNTMYDPSVLNQYVYWVAHYNGGGAPLRKGAYHQWTDQGRVNGINGNVDMDNCYIIMATPSSNPEPTPEPKPEPTSAPQTNYDFSKYFNKISNCGKDENGGISGGQAGDQTGKEWWIINWYNQNWQCVLRHPNKEVRELIAQLAIEAAENNNVGYDQSQNRTFWGELQKCGYHPKNITIPCEADCSAGVIAITMAVGHLLNISALKSINATYTGNMRSGYRAAGFQVLTDSKYLTGSSYLLPGDIILNDSQHTATNLGYGSNAEQSTPSVDPDKKYGIVTANVLNVRSGPGTTYSIVAQILNGTQVEILGEATAANGAKWYQIPNGYVSAAYIQ